ncbi:MAG: hypothetical protein WD598_11630 [Acidimicrobiia bacterium]
MPATRVSPNEQMALALEELQYLGSLIDDVSIVPSPPEHAHFYFPDGVPDWPARVFAYDNLDEGQARRLIADAARGHYVVVANRITEPARRLLSSHKWAWVDRRIGAHIPTAKGSFEIRYASRDEAPRPTIEGPIRGRAGIAYAAALLCFPHEPPSLRKIAAEVGMSPTALSNAAKHLVAAGLVGPHSKPSLPDLFWALVEVWSPVKTFAIASVPEPRARGFSTNIERLDQPGWVLGGDLAAAGLGAPVFNLERHPWLWIPTQVDLRRARRAYGSASWEERAAVIAVPPTPLVNRWRRPSANSSWPLPHPVFAALELARDPGRGREILEQWSPEGIQVVWR